MLYVNGCSLVVYFFVNRCLGHPVAHSVFDRYTVDVGPYKSTHRFCEEKADILGGCRKRTLNERFNGWLVKMASVEVLR